MANDAGIVLMFDESPLSLDIPHIGQYFGAWAIEESHMRQLSGLVQSINLSAHVEQRQQIAENAGYEIVQGDIAVVSIEGAMTKYGSSLSSSGSTIRARRAIRQAMSDDSIAGIVLRIDSPGGSVAGTKELADDIYSADQQKPVWAVVEDLGASAAYYVASQARQIFANEPAFVGSIGTYMVVIDVSKAAEKAGYKVHVIRAGDMKGAGVPGTEITESQLAYFQTLIDKQNDLFLKAVSRGRRLSMQQVNSLADGRVHIASDALGLQLIDGIATFDEVVGKFSLFLKGPDMSTDTKVSTPVPATIAELRAACPGADSEFVLKQLELGATVQAAQSAFIVHQQAKLEAAVQQVNELTAKNTELSTKIDQLQQMPGNEPLESKKTSSTGNVLQEWNKLIAEQLAANPAMHRSRAVSIVAKANPELHRALVESANVSA
jgi:signal peptide peptidase SppA